MDGMMNMFLQKEELTLSTMELASSIVAEASGVDRLVDDREHDDDEEEHPLIGPDTKLGLDRHVHHLNRHRQHHHEADSHHHLHHKSKASKLGSLAKALDLTGSVGVSDGHPHHDGLRSDSVVGELSTSMLTGEGSSGGSHLHTEASVVDLYNSSGNPYSSPFVVYPAGFYPSAFNMMDRASANSVFPGTFPSSTSNSNNLTSDGNQRYSSSKRVGSDFKLSSRESERSSSISPKSPSSLKAPILRAVDISHSSVPTLPSLSSSGLAIPSTPPALLSMHEREKDDFVKDDLGLSRGISDVGSASGLTQGMPVPANLNMFAAPSSMTQNLRYSGLLSEVMPDTAADPVSARIRVWLDSENKLFYDCFCGKRKPIRNLKGIKHHCARHDHQVFQCEKCDRVFSHYLGLNSHRKAHREEEPTSVLDRSMLHHSSI